MKNAMMVLVCGCFLFGCDEGTSNTDTDTSNQCALKGDRPSWCDEDAIDGEDGHGPPVCGDGVCTNTGYYDSETCDECPEDCGLCHYCGDSVCHSWDMLHAIPYVWEEGTAEDCGNCAEDCLCDKWGFTCKVTGTYDDAWEGEKSECADDPWYEFKLAITGTYEDSYGSPYTLSPTTFTSIPGCSCGSFTLGDDIMEWCFTEPSLADCDKPTAPAGTWFACNMLAKDFGENMKQWCDALTEEQHCYGDCEQLGVKVSFCGFQLTKISHQLMQ